MNSVVTLDAGEETRTIEATKEGTRFTVVGSVIDELVKGAVAEVTKVEERVVVVEDVVKSDDSVGDIAIADTTSVAVVALIELALLTLPCFYVDKPVILLVTLVAESHVVAD